MLLCGCGHGKAVEPWVRKVVFAGVHHVSERDLRGRLAVQATGWWPFAKKQLLDPFSLELDARRIEAYYHTQGYFLAHVKSTQIEGGRDHSVIVRFRVEEGLPTRITGVQIAGGLGELGKTGARLENQFLKEVHVGEIYREPEYLQARDRLEARLKMLGHAYARVEGQVDVNRDALSADVHLDVIPNPVATLGQIIVHGARRVSPQKIALHSGLVPGKRFNPADLEGAKGKLYNLGLFTSVGVEYEHNPKNPDVADVIINVKEGKFHEIRLGVGLGLEPERNDVHVSGIYTQRNFLGGLRTFQAKLSVDYVVIPEFWDIYRQGPALSAEATFTQPDIFWHFSDLKWVVGYDVGIDYAYQYHGPRTTIGISSPINPWRDHLRVSLAYNFQFLSFFNTDPTILQDPSQAGLLYGYHDPYLLGYWQQDVTVDLRDKPVDARRGVYLALAAEESGEWSGSQFDYQKLTPEVRGYVPIGSRVVLAARAMYGKIFSQGDLGSPITRRFYLGGPNSHRGFSYDRLSVQVPTCPYQWHYVPVVPVSLAPGLPPVDVDRCVPNQVTPQTPNPSKLPGGINMQQNPQNLDVTLLPIGGDEMVLFSGEVRVNLFQIYDQWISAAVFVDGGDVAAPSAMLPASLGRGLDFTNLHWATGGGLRYHTVIGTLRADLGIRLNRLDPVQVPVPTTNALGQPSVLLFQKNPDPGQRYVFHLSIGEAF